MRREIQIWLWGIVSELEYQLYPWKSSTPPDWAKERYGADTSIHDNHEFSNDVLHYDWLKAHDQKIGRLQDEVIWLQKQVRELKEK